MPSPLLLPAGNIVLLFFLPHSLWRTSCYGNTSARCRRCFYPRPLHGGRQGNFSLSELPDRFLSTHALLTEGDTPWPRRTSDRRHFYPRPPRGGRHAHPQRTQMVGQNFYPHPPHGGRPCNLVIDYQVRIISTHALHAEGEQKSTSKRSLSAR